MMPALDKDVLVLIEGSGFMVCYLNARGDFCSRETEHWSLGDIYYWCELPEANK
jgi:hypothetical protein